MQQDFWLECWDKGNIGFHRTDVHPLLRQWWPTLNIAGNAPVWVPLCGKTLDMPWLRNQGHQVRGVELSRRALDDFISEQHLQLTWQAQPPLNVASGDGYQLYQGDLFDCGPRQLEDIAALYDRAALIALPENLRRDYVQHMRNNVQAGTPLLLITMSYPPGSIQGPPFSVSAQEVALLFQGCEIELLQTRNAIGDFPGLAARGVTALTEQAWRIQLAPDSSI